MDLAASFQSQVFYVPFIQPKFIRLLSYRDEFDYPLIIIIKMLTADKNATLTEFQIQTLQIREKELNYFVGLYNSISGIAAMLAGFGFSSLKMSVPSSTS